MDGSRAGEEAGLAGRFVRTLTGDVAPDSLGATLIHEHLSVDWGEMLGRPKVLDWDPAEMADRMVGKLEALAAVGIGAMTECTPYGCGRYVDLFAEVARRSPVRIVASTGFFHESWCPIHPVAAALDLDALEDLMVREIAEGMGGTRVRAGLIKVATGKDRISPVEERVLRAAARARRRTGCPIITHITDSMAQEQLDVLASEGVGPDEVVVSHVGFADDPFAESEALLRRGANVSFDRIGYRLFFPDEHWLALVANAVEKGFVRQVMLSHDAAVFAHGLEVASGDQVWDDYTYISRVFLPRLRAETRVTEDDVHAMLVENPQRVLAFA
jgi:phosphotriesterase-related protein